MAVAATSAPRWLLSLLGALASAVETVIAAGNLQEQAVISGLLADRDGTGNCAIILYALATMLKATLLRRCLSGSRDFEMKRRRLGSVLIDRQVVTTTSPHLQLRQLRRKLITAKLRIPLAVVIVKQCG